MTDNTKQDEFEPEKFSWFNHQTGEIIRQRKCPKCGTITVQVQEVR